MNLMNGWVRLKARRDRMDAYHQAKSNYLAITDVDLADMGAKRYQLDSAARVKALS